MGDSGTMSAHWPQNTVWLGGHWSAANSGWEWDDGTPMSQVRWARDQPNPTASEPWLCMVPDGHVRHAGESKTSAFGIMCQTPQAQYESRGMSAQTGFETSILDDTAAVIFDGLDRSDTKRESQLQLMRCRVGRTRALRDRPSRQHSG